MKRAMVLLAALGLLLAACGSEDESHGGHMSGDDGGSAARTIQVQMVDNAFTPQSVEVEAGEKVTFEFTNTGKVDHEAILGDEQAQSDHEKEMNGEDDMSGHDMGGDMDDEDMGGGDMDHGTDAITVKPGKTGTLTHTFTAEEDGILIGCHEPDHYDDGMRLEVAVT